MLQLKTMFDNKVTTAASELLDVDDVKTHLAITHTDDDAYLTDLIKQVRASVERYCGISIGAQTRRWVYDEWEQWPDNEATIPYGPITAVTDVTRRTGPGTTDTLAADDDYEVQGELFKTITVPGGGRCTVTYTCGYSTLPDDLKRGMLEEIAYRYEHRGDAKDGLSDRAINYLIRFKDMNW